MKNFLILFLVSFAFLSAKEQEAPYLTSECDALALVEGIVNAYNGKFIQIDQDIEIQGQDPLEMTRYYDGGHHFCSEFGYGIGCPYPALLRYVYDDDKSYVFIELRMGCEVLFEVKKDKKKGKNVFVGRVAKDYFKSGYTNCCEALLRGEPSIYAMQVEVSAQKAVVNFGNGTKHHYKHYIDNSNEGSYYLLHLEERGNGNRRHFSYDYSGGIFRLKRISTTNRDETLILNWLNFDYNGLHVTVRGSNGQEARYVKQVETGIAKKGNLFSGYKAKPNEEILKQASIDHCPAIQYEVLKNAHSLSTVFSLSKVKKANGRFLEVEYDNNERVKKLYSSGIKTPLYTFDYHTGYTIATDATGAKKRFEFTKRRLTKFVEEHRIQDFVWDTKGQLTAHTVSNREGALLSKQSYTYDERGNILEVKLEGCLTKNKSHDASITNYTYSKDNNLILTENHNKEVEYVYSYHSGTVLPASKLTYVSKKILEREFYIYDKNSILICKIVDDGCKPDRDDLEQVTYRLITEIKPHLNPDLPGMTLPHFISEFYQELKTGQKQLLKKTEQLYTQGDLLSEERVFDATGTYLYSLFYKYNERRELISETNALGETTCYGYDDHGNKIYEEKLNSGKKTEFIYDKANHLTQEIEEHPDRLFKKTYEYDPMGNLLSSKDIYGQKTSYQYDLSSREISCTDPLGNVEQKEYDALGNITKVIDKNGYITETCYNLFNDPLEIRYPDASLKKFSYNVQGHLVQEWNRDGTSVIYHVDYKGRVQEARTYGSDGIHLRTLTYKYKGPHLIQETDALGNTISYNYDDAGRKIAKIQENIKTFYDYDTLGRLSKTRQANQINITEFDFLNRVIEERIEDPIGEVYHKVQYEYDLLGNVSATKEFSNINDYVKRETLYNSQSMPILEIDSLGYQTKISYQQTDHLEKETVDPSGRSTIEVYDPLLRLKEIKILSSTGTLLANTSFTYDNRGNQITKQEKVILNGQQIDTYTITAIYDGMNQKVKESEQNRKTTEWGYKNGRLQTLKMPNGVIFTYHYDPLGRLQKLISSDQTIHEVYTYDLNDNLLQADDFIHQTTTLRTYDYLNRVVYEKQATGFEYEFSYDDLNRLRKMTFCEGTIIYNYSPLHLLSASRYKNDQLLYTYAQKLDWRGKIEQAILPNQTKVDYRRDKMGRCSEINAASYKQCLTYDAIGNLIETEVQDGIGSYRAGFTYDGLNQLLSETGPFENNYSHDSIYNRREKNGYSLKIDPLNHLLNDSSEAYNYDLNGRRTQKGDTLYSYDALGRLTAFHQGGQTVTFQYDPLGRRLSTTSADSTLYYLYQLDTEIGAFSQGKPKEFRLTDKKATLAIELNESCYSPIKNSRGDICQLQDDKQNTLATYRYDAFGICVQEGILPSPWLFSGQRYDPVTNLYHFDKREYDPEVGRWLTADPLGFEAGSNLFAYVNNNPLIYIDPHGLFLAEAKDFTNGVARGIADDSSWGASGRVLGTYRPTTTFGRYGYYLGTSASFAAGLLSGGTELRLVTKATVALTKGATALAKGVFSKTARKTTAKPLRETHKVIKATNQTPAKQVCDQLKTAEVSAVAKEGASEVAKKTGRNRFIPDPNATGAHSVFRRDSVGKVTHYETYTLQTNLRNPNRWESMKRYDSSSLGPGQRSPSHYNKVLQQKIYEPHIHDPYYPGGVRSPLPWETP